MDVIKTKKLIKSFCKKKDTAYLDKIDPKVVKYLDDFIHRNSKKLEKNEIAKIVQKYVKKRTEEELETVDTVTDMYYLQYNILPNVLPEVLETLLSAMLGMKKYTEKQMVIYRYASSTYGKKKIVSDSEEESDERKKWDKTYTGEKSDSPTPPKISKPARKCNVTGLNYKGNSCYMDSALLCTFVIPNKTITDNILKKDLSMLKTMSRKLWSTCDENIDKDIKRRQAIQKALNNITESMRGLNNVKTCSNLRSLIANCPGPQPFHEEDTQDSGEFLTYIFNLFQVDVARTSRSTYGSNDLGNNPKWQLVSKYKDDYSSPLIEIKSTTLTNIQENYDITLFVKQREDSILGEYDKWIYKRRKEVFKIKESPIVIFNLIRTYGEPVFEKPKTTKEKLEGRGKYKGIKTIEIWKKVSAPETMTLNGKKLDLNAIVVHTGGAHYIANFKCNGKWFWYDDNPSSSKHVIKYVGSYENMLQTKPKPLTHGTLFFYT